MKRVGIAYATSDGHTRKIAHHIADNLTSLGLDVETWDVKRKDSDRTLTAFDAVILAAPVRAERHLPAMMKFVRRHLGELRVTPAAFLTISLSQAGVERPVATREERIQFSADVEKVLTRFFRETGWHPLFTKAVAGALLYTQYNFLVRMIMKRISRKSGGSTDTTHDHDYTDWKALDAFIGEFINAVLFPKTACERGPAAVVGVSPR